MIESYMAKHYHYATGKFINSKYNGRLNILIKSPFHFVFVYVWLVRFKFSIFQPLLAGQGPFHITISSSGKSFVLLLPFLAKILTWIRIQKLDCWHGLAMICVSVQWRWLQQDWCGFHFTTPVSDRSINNYGG